MRALTDGGATAALTGPLLGRGPAVLAARVQIMTVRALRLVPAALLAACASTRPAPLAEAPPTTAEQSLARAMASAVEAVCLPAQAASRLLPRHVDAAGGPDALGLRPAPPPATGWTSRADPRVGVAEEQRSCVVRAAGPDAPGALAPLMAALSGPYGTAQASERTSPGGAYVRRFCRDAASFAVIATDEALVVATPSRLVACEVPIPLPPSVAPRG